MTRGSLLFAGALLAALFAAETACAQSVTVERDSALYAEPRLDAARVAELKAGTAGEVVGKSGAWLRLEVGDASGWLFSFNVRFAPQSAEGADRPAGAGSVLGRLFGPRRSVNVTSTIGIRGLEEEDLKQARFDAAQMSLLDRHAASKEGAEEQARASGLVPVAVEYLEEGGR